MPRRCSFGTAYKPAPISFEILVVAHASAQMDFAFKSLGASSGCTVLAQKSARTIVCFDAYIGSFGF